MSPQKIGVLGSGPVGRVLASGFLRHGYEVMLGSRDPNKIADWQSETDGRGEIGTFAEAAGFGELVIHAGKGSVAGAVLELAGAARLEGKVVIDATNPVADEPPDNGVLELFTGTTSLMEQLQERVPAARFVKAFSCVGAASMVDPDFPGGRPTMFICGNDAAAKADVTKILDQFGWDTEDMGGMRAARAIEPLCVLWCIPGFLRNEWSHAFKLLKM